MKHRYFLIGTIVALITCSSFHAFGQSGTLTEEYVLMRTIDLAPVHRGHSKYSIIYAKINPGAIVKVRRRAASKDCRPGWMQRQSGGYICATHLKKTTQTSAQPAPEDIPGISNQLKAYLVTRRGPRLYRNLKSLNRGRVYKVLRKGSVLKVRRSIIHDGQKYHQTREGFFVEAKSLELLPPPEGALAIEVGSRIPGGIVISDHTQVYDGPRGSVLSTIPRWSVIFSPDGQPLKADNGWVALGDGRFVKDDSIARVRSVPMPQNLKLKEHWLAVDLSEQMLHAYEGDRLVRVMPCSTGIKDNTRPGRYRIQWKRRMQTLRMKQGEIRVEDVPWVMFYDRDDGIAIHSAFWHGDFGKRKSHGCVNLTPDDAGWVFQWSSPSLVKSDSERFPTSQEPGSRVVVFN